MRPSTTKHSNSRRGVGGNLSHPPPQRTITPSSTAGKKRQGGSDSSGSGSGSVGRNNKRQKVDIMDLDPIFPTLDQSDPVHARRIQQRRKMVQMGKNTAGYFEYTKKVPKEKRRPRSMDTPSTPDHTLDIPTKRWQGMIKAWRKALHKYDPEDLQSSNAFNAAAHAPGAGHTAASKSQKEKKEEATTVQSRQIKDALASGLLVDVYPAGGTNDNNDDDEVDFCSPESLPLEIDRKGNQNPTDLEAFMHDESKVDEFGADDDDSDDDLL